MTYARQRYMTDSSSPPRAVPAARRAGLGAPVAATRPLLSAGHIDYFTVDTADVERRLAEAERRYDLLAIRLECEALLADDNPLTIREVT